MLDTEYPFYEYDLLGILKAVFVPRIFVDATDECPNIRQVVELVKGVGAVLCYAYLGDVGDSVTGDKKAQKFEDDYLDEVFQCLKDCGVPAVTYMPTRNTPAQLERVRKLCDDNGIFPGLRRGHQFAPPGLRHQGHGKPHVQESDRRHLEAHRLRNGQYTYIYLQKTRGAMLRVFFSVQAVLSSVSGSRRARSTSGMSSSPTIRSICSSFSQSSGEKRLRTPFHDLQHIAVSDVVILQILFRHPQVILPAVVFAAHLFQISLPDQAGHLVGRIGRRDPGKGCKFIDRRLPQRLDGFHAVGFHRGQAGLPVLKLAEDLEIKMAA